MANINTSFDLKTSHNYARFIERTMKPLTEIATAPVGSELRDPLAPEIPQVNATAVRIALIRAESTWRHAQHVRHMVGFYGVQP